MRDTMNRARGTWVPLALVVGLLIGPVALLTPVSAGGATTFTVNTADDTNDGVCNTANCSLADAIVAANTNQGIDKIAFNIPGNGPHEIAITDSTELPTIEDPVTIDGYTEPGAKKNTLDKGTNAKIQISLDGDPLQTFGFVVNAGPTTIRGIEFGDHFTCVILNDGTGNVIEGNFFGRVDPTPRGCFFDGVQVNANSANTRIGGSKPAQRNFMVLSGGGDDGGSTGGGFKLFSADNTVTGNAFGRKKSGDECGNGNIVLPNFIFGNDNLVTKNEFCAYSIQVTTGDGNKISQNTFFTSPIPIILSSGGNTNQARPVITDAETNGDSTKIKATLTSTANTEFVIEFFSGPGVNDAATKFLGKLKVKTDGGGVVNFAFKPSKKVPVGRNVTATATDPNGNTSAFAFDVDVT